MITVISRIDVWEALLIGVPHLIITDEDKADAAKNHWSLPEKASGFILGNTKAGIRIFDRRNAALAQNVSESADVLKRELAHALVPGWVLAYLPDQTEEQGLIAKRNQSLHLELAMLIGVGGAVVLAAWSVVALVLGKKKRGNAKLLKIACLLDAEANQITVAAASFLEASNRLSGGANQQGTVLAEEDLCPGAVGGDDPPQQRKRGPGFDDLQSSKYRRRPRGGADPGNAGHDE